MEKAPEAFRTISEVADELAVPKHVLRFWEGRFSQLKPMKRGGGRRYYRPEDVDLLRGIRHLLYEEGYTIKGVQKILRESGSRSLLLHRRTRDEMSHANREIEIPDLAAEAAHGAARRESGERGSPEGIPELAEGGMLGWLIDEIEQCRRILSDAKSAP